MPGNLLWAQRTAVCLLEPQALRERGVAGGGPALVYGQCASLRRGAPVQWGTDYKARGGWEVPISVK